MAKKLPDIAALARELEGVDALLKEQLNAGLDRGETIEAIHGNWILQFEQLHSLSSADAAMLTAAVNSVESWDSDKKKSQSLAKLIQKAMVKLSGTKAKTLGPRRAAQHAPQFENYITEKLWIDLRKLEEYSFASRCHLLARLAAQLGIVNPQPKLLYRLVSILAFAEQNYDMSQEDVFAAMDKIQDFIKGYNQPPDAPYLETFGADANELPEVLKQRAYPDGKMPIQVTIPELDSVLGPNRMRGRQNVSKWLDKIPAEYHDSLLAKHPELNTSRRRHASKSTPPQPWQREALHSSVKHEHKHSPVKLQQTANALLKSERQELSLPSPTAAASRPQFGLLSVKRDLCVQCGKSKGGQEDATKSGKGDADSTSESEKDDVAAKDTEVAHGSVEAMELAMSGALPMKKSKGKHSAEPPAGGPMKKAMSKPPAGGPMKKAMSKSEAKSGSAMKPCTRTSATGGGTPMKKTMGTPIGKIGLKDIYDRMKSDFKRPGGISKKDFSNRVYHRAEYRAKKAGWSPAAVVALKKQEFARASKLYDELLKQ